MSSTLLMRKVFFLSVLFLVSILFSCKKDGELSPDFDKGSLSIMFTDTFSVKSTVEKDDSSQTGLIPLHLLGASYDPIFGTKSSSIYTNVGLAGATEFDPDYKDSLIFVPGFIVDSLVLSLKLSNYYGNIGSSFTVNAYELTEALSSSESYFSNTYSGVKTTLLGSTNYTPSVLNSDSTFIRSADSDLRIVITDPTLISNIESKTSYTTNSDLQEVFKGLYLVSSSSSAIPQNLGGFALFDFNSPSSKVTIHYHNGNDLIEKEESLVLNSNVKTYSRFIHDYSGTDIEKHLAGDVARNINRIYVSDMEGVRTKIEIPNIKNLADQGNVAINKAELIFTIESGTDIDPNSVLEAITLSGIDSEGNPFDLTDAKEGRSHFGGTYNSTSKTFSFNITRHLQQIITERRTDYGMYLTPNSAIVVPFRAVFNSENSPTFKTKLEITYSKL